MDINVGGCTQEIGRGSGGFVLPKIEIWLYFILYQFRVLQRRWATRNVRALRDYRIWLIAMKVSMARLRRDNARRS
jgi:hypothetical protein